MYISWREPLSHGQRGFCFHMRILRKSFASAALCKVELSRISAMECLAQALKKCKLRAPSSLLSPASHILHKSYTNPKHHFRCYCPLPVSPAKSYASHMQILRNWRVLHESITFKGHFFVWGFMIQNQFHWISTCMIQLRYNCIRPVNIT